MTPGQLCFDTARPSVMTAAQADCLATWRTLGAGTDHAAAVLHAVRPGARTQSPSGLRTRRKELVGMGYLTDTGRKEAPRPGARKASVWALTQQSTGHPVGASSVTPWLDGTAAGLGEADDLVAGGDDSTALAVSSPPARSL